MRGTVVAAMAMVLCTVASASQANLIESFFGKTRGFSAASAVHNECKVDAIITTDFEYHQASMTRDPAAISGTADHGDILEGLTIANYGYEVSLEFETIETPRDGCTRLSAIHIHAGSKQPVIWIRPEIRAGSCSYGVTLKHEREHVAVYHGYLRKFESSLKKELPILLKGQTFIHSSDMPYHDAMEHLETTAVSLIQNMHERWNREAHRRNEAMDTPEEYSRLSRLCP